MQRRVTNTRARWFKCSRCGTLNRAVKRGDKMTPLGHPKTFYCWKCQSYTRQYQVK